MWKKFAKDYLSFTKKDRIGLLVLVTLIFLVVLLPYLWPAKKAAQITEQEKEQLRVQTAQLNKPVEEPAATPENESRTGSYNFPARKDDHAVKASLFYFDPNTLDAAGWQRLGIREKTAGTIVKYVSKGGRFRQPADISKIYGLHKEDYERLLPFVKINHQPVTEKKYGDQRKEYVNADRPAYVFKRAALKAIDINIADTTAFIALPGIGSKLAARIINFRDKLGGFCSVQQVGETYGLPDSTFSKIQALLLCDKPPVKQIDINKADANVLKQHPYIRWSMANAIVQYRAQHGNFKSVDDLLQIAVITPELLKKIKPYMTIQ